MKQMIKRKDGSYSQRGLWDNIRANKGSGKKPTKEMLKQETKIKKESRLKKAYMAKGGTISHTTKGPGANYRPTKQGAGMTQKGVDAANRKSGGNLQTAVTGKVKAGSKDAKRRKSFCARMSGMKGPMKDEKGRPTRKAMSLRRWKC